MYKKCSKRFIGKLLYVSFLKKRIFGAVKTFENDQKFYWFKVGSTVIDSFCTSCWWGWKIILIYFKFTVWDALSKVIKGFTGLLLLDFIGYSNTTGQLSKIRHKWWIISKMIINQTEFYFISMSNYESICIMQPFLLCMKAMYWTDYQLKR